jgi:hypothetical protein
MSKEKSPIKASVTRKGLGSIKPGIKPLVLNSCHISKIAAMGITGSQLSLIKFRNLIIISPPKKKRLHG